ncbi:OmpA family protein [Penaeicola halotolerans]|uniref:OmpA family protein n=1 Tax=Penaeicola halotolerans TaxID=2793196 RepID=UPI001CF886C0|nr:OmpA family protein [Penaeicola halotolerans]
MRPFVSNIMLLLTLCFVLGCASSSKKAATKPSPEAFDNGDYQLAIAYYETILEKDPYNAEANFKIGEAYRLTNRAAKSADYYRTAFEQNYADPAVGYYYALALKAQGEYEEAAKEFKDYADFAEEGDPLANRARLEVANIEAMDSLPDIGQYIEIRNLDVLNTETIDYAPFFFKGELYFTSSRGNTGIYQAIGEPFTQLYKTRANGLFPDGQNIVALPDFINKENVNVGSIAISSDGNFMIFARGNSGDPEDTKEVNLYQSRNQGGVWSEPEFLPINDPLSWDSNPSFNRAGTTIYFSSNRPGGYGGLDLYSATLDERGRWGNVRNMGGDINTPGNEMFPYISDDNKLYFASDGHPGFGQLDIFVAERKDGVTTISNMGKGINSPADDFGISYTRYPFEAYFASNREGGKGDDDIYAFVDNSPSLKKVNYILTGTAVDILDDGSEELLPNTKVRLIDGENTLAEVNTTSSGRFRFDVSTEKNYILIGEKSNYFTARSSYSTVGKTVNKDTLVQEVTTVTFDTKLVLDKIVLEKAIVLENIYYDLDKSDIRPDAALELDKLVQVLVDNPDIRIELSSHTDSRGNDAYNLALSQRRAQSAVDYIISKGISADRLTARGYGETRLVNDCGNGVNCTEEQHQENRRTEFKVTEIQENPEEETEVEENTSEQ